MARTALAVIAAALLTLALATPAHAAVGTWGPAIDLSGASVNAFYPQVVVAADGTLVSIWQGDDGSGTVVQSSRSVDAGLTWIGAVAISGTDASYNPQLAIASNGTIIATWYRNGIVQTTASADNGATWSAPADISGVAGNVNNPQISAGDDGTVAVTWELRVGGFWSVAESTSSDAGATWSTPTLMMLPVNSADSNDVVVTDADTIVATWIANYGVGRTVQVARSVDGGATFSVPTDLSAPNGAFNPRIAVSPDGTITATWQRYGVVSSVIQTSRSVDGGASWSAPVELSVDGVDSYNARIAIAADGTIAVTWERGNGGVERIVQVATSTDSGASWSAPVDLSAVGVYSDVPAIVAAPDGSFTVAWERDIAGASIIEVSTLNGAIWSAPLQLSGSSGFAYEVQLAAAANSAVTAVWQHDDGFGLNTIQASTLAVAAAAVEPALAAGGTDALPLGLAGAVLLAAGAVLLHPFASDYHSRRRAVVKWRKWMRGAAA